MNKKTQEYFQGCLIGGAIGDGLGWPIEFMDWGSIQRTYGESGIQDLVLRNGVAEITDDTQMTLFTAEGILRSQSRMRKMGVCDPQSVMQFAYLRWLHTQGYPQREELEWIYDGFLIKNSGLFHSRAPGNSCISALQNYKPKLNKDEPVNNSKGCGGIMRMAPAGLFYKKGEAFRRGVEFAQLTHGHPDGYIPAGAIAYLIASIIDGTPLFEAANDTLSYIDGKSGANRVSELLRQAIKYAESDIPEQICIADLGEGWTGEEALAISVYCALKYKDDFLSAIRAAVNHDGDSDSTGSITGNILGAYLGINSIPKDWIDKIELYDLIMEVANDLLIGLKENEKWIEKYPGI